MVDTALGEGFEYPPRSVAIETPPFQSESIASSRRSLMPNPVSSSLHGSRLVSSGSRIVLGDEDSCVRLSGTSEGEDVLLAPEYTLS